jgi:hypothetical protein
MALVTVAPPGQADETLPWVARFEAEEDDVEEFDDDGDWDELDDPEELDDDDLDDWDDDFDDEELGEEKPAAGEDGDEQ